MEQLKCLSGKTQQEIQLWVCQKDPISTFFTLMKANALPWAEAAAYRCYWTVKCKARLYPGSALPREVWQTWCLLDHRVHGRNALSHNQGLAVGDVIEGRARVTSQNHLGGRCQERSHSQALALQMFGSFPVWQRSVLLVSSDAFQQLPKLHRNT